MLDTCLFFLVCYNDTMKIGVFDSGVGGLTILEELVRELPGCDFYFYGDHKNNPYGKKSDEELLAITSEIVDYLIAKGCQIIVIACNTATTRCRNQLMKKYPDTIFIGTVPAVKVACDHGYHNVLVLGTPATIGSVRMSELINDNIKPDQQIHAVACPGLAEAIENDNEEEVEKILNSLHEQYENEEVDAIVLGCTHYPFKKEKFEQLWPNATVIDGANGVARETRHQAALKGETFENNGKGRLEVTFSGK